MSHAEVRRDRMNKIKDSMQGALDKGKEVNEEKLIAICCIEWGTTTKTIKDYISMIKIAGVLKYGK